jgi:hypothetical protein
VRSWQARAAARWLTPQASARCIVPRANLRGNLVVSAGAPTIMRQRSHVLPTGTLTRPCWHRIGPPPPRTKWTRRVLHPVLIGHAP